MPYTTPHTIAAAELVTVATMNNEWGGNIAFLANPPACRVYHNTTQSISDALEATVIFNSERYDTNTMHDTVTNNSRITLNTAGIYQVGFSGNFPTLITYSNVYCTIRLNGSTNIALVQLTPTTFNAAEFLNVNTTYKFAAADYIEARVYQDNTANTAQNLQNNGNYSPEFWATWIGLG